MIELTLTKDWNEFASDDKCTSALLNSLHDYFRSARWFGGKAYHLEDIRLDHCLPLDFEGERFFLLIAETNYSDHTPEYYLLPLALDSGQEIPQNALLARCGDKWLVDAVYCPRFHKAMFNHILADSRLKIGNGELNFDRGAGLNTEQQYQTSRNPGVDQSNSSIFFNEKYFMKIYRKLFLDTNPEVEMLKFLTEVGGYKHVPAYRGSLIWERKKTAPVTFALMMYKVDARKDNWATTGDELNDFLHAFIKGYFSIHEFVFEHVQLLAKRTAEMHLALSNDTSDKAFKVEKFNPKYREWLYAHLKNLVEGRLQMLESNRHLLDDEAKRMAQLLSEKKDVVLRFFEKIRKKPLKSLRTRIHGDYHLGQVLHTGQDFIIIDFEGEPESTIADRKIKHSPLKDVAGMIRSFHYAVSAKLFYSEETKGADKTKLQNASDRWFYLIRETFTETYLEALGKDQQLYASKAEINFLFLLHLLEKAIYEVGYELNGRPDWLKIPLKGIEQVINELEKYED
jgi:maltose alpha-D-glucosyltransferase/alpha-amylase